MRLDANEPTAWLIEGATVNGRQQVNRVAPPGTGAEPDMAAVVSAIEEGEA
jgi:hypothetical protein